MKTPRPSQKLVINAVIKALDTKQQALLVSPTGSGKTLISAEVVKRIIKDNKQNPSYRILILAHNGEILRNNAAVFKEQIPDLTVSWLTQDTKEVEGKFVFGMMISTLNQLHNIGRFDALLIDECHRMKGRSYTNIRNTLLKRNPDLKLLGATATIRRSDNQSLKDLFTQEQVVAGQDYFELMSAGFLVRARPFAFAIVPKEKVRKLKILKTGDYSPKEIEHLYNHLPTHEAIYDEWVKIAAKRKTVFFAATIQHAIDFNQVLLSHGENSAVLHSNIDKYTRANILGRFKTGKIQIIINVAILTEGFDEPTIDCIGLLRPLSSLSVIVQMVGRGLRVSKEIVSGQLPIIKRDCLILDFGHSLMQYGSKVFRLQTQLEEEEKEAGVSKFKEDSDTFITCYVCNALNPSDSDKCSNCGEVFGELEREDNFSYTDDIEMRELYLIPNSKDDEKVVSINVNKQKNTEPEPEPEPEYIPTCSRSIKSDALESFSDFLTPFEDFYMTRYMWMSFYLKGVPLLVVATLEEAMFIYPLRDRTLNETNWKELASVQKGIEFISYSPSRNSKIIQTHASLERCIEATEDYLYNDLRQESYYRRNVLNKTFTRKSSASQKRFMKSINILVDADNPITGYEAKCLIAIRRSGQQLVHLTNSQR